MSDVTPTEPELPINPDYFTGPQVKILKAMDNKNIDTSELEQLFLDALATYEAASDGVEPSAGTAPADDPAAG